VEQVPKPVARDLKAGLAIYSFIEGEAPARHDSRPEAIEPLISFLAALHGLRLSSDAAKLPLAAEAAIEPPMIIQQIESRLARLSAFPSDNEIGAALHAFIVNQLRPALAQRRLVVEQLTPISLQRATLSPSDFGFHNAIHRPDGRLFFVDFEYFGWDDPAKLICDTLLHPHEYMQLSNTQKIYWMEQCLALYDDPDLKGRVEILFPMLGLKWSLILLNEFIPAEANRRAFAGEITDSAKLARQLEKSENMLYDSNHYWVGNRSIFV
jgi:hypothetical protein